MSFETIGLHSIPSEEPVHLIEAHIKSFNGEFDFGLLFQPDPTVPEMNWQTAWRPFLLSEDGDSGEPYFGFDPLNIDCNQRILFFLHYTNLDLPISTPFGEVALPSESPLPARLNFARYEPVD